MAVQFGTKLSLFILEITFCNEHPSESVMKLQYGPPYIVISYEAAGSLLKLLQP
jgi:hypothetical protein